MLYRSALDLIGHTPLLKLENIVPKSGANLYAKLEMFNLTGSIKDRSALGMVEAAEQDGTLKPGKVVVEATSGNLGIALAAIAQQKGYKLLCVVDKFTDLAKTDQIRALGGKIAIVTEPDADGSYKTARYKKVQQLLAEMPRAVNLNQYHNPKNAETHYATTGPEIYKDLGGKVDMLVAAAGTCGTLCGTARYLKEQNPGIRVVGVEPEGSILFGGEYYTFYTHGSGISFIPDNYDPTVVDEKLKLADKYAFAAARKLAATESLLVGSSAGSALHVALEKAVELPPESNVVVIFPDHGNRYLDTLFSDEWLQQKGLSL
jgi:2,3-diaminopropionate biosynthesis protein SbnA